MFAGLIGTWPGRALVGALVAVLIGTPILIGRITSSPAAAETRTAPVTRASVTQTVAVSGSVNAGGTIRLNFQTSGRVAEILVKVGDRVTAGQLLARLDTATLEVAVAQAQANLTSAQARYEQALAGALPEDVAAAATSVANAQRSLETARRTAETDVATAKQTLARVTGGYTVARTNFSALVAQVRTDADALTQAVSDLQRQHGDMLTIAYALPGSTDARTVQTSLGGATAPLATAVSAASTLLRDALTELGAAQAALLASAGTFDSVLASGADTSAAAGGYQSSLIAYQSAVTRLNAAIDVVNGQLSGPQSSIASALATLNSSSARQQTDFDSLREGLRFLTDRVIAAQQLASSAKSRLAQAGTTLNTVTDAIANGLVSATQAVPAAQERGASSIANAESALASAQASYARTAAAPKSSDIATAYASVLQAELALQTAQNTLANAALRAPAPGVVAALTGQVGEAASGTAASPFLSIANVTTLQLHGTVGEADVAKLRLGQVATVTVDAVGAGSRMTGKVTGIDPVATIQQGVPVYGVDVTVDVPDAAVRPGMSGTASVILVSKTNVLTVPNLAIRSTGGRRGVQVMRDGRPVDAEVVFGIATDSVTEVVSGLEEGDLVVLPAPRTGTTTTQQQQQQIQQRLGGGGVQIR
ncbi:MAG TPA: biotin/lipoyl-binding protein [Candidatus Limnocylindria bacterium]|nr:biotin/lipoyl-binding protein [Candidatus Limnocylindria bacterium]